ncbi:MAG: hypothetical protein ACOX37_12785 [Bacillota bacterium]
MLFREQALMSKRLATIDCGAPLEFDLASCTYRDSRIIPRLLALYKELEFNSLIKDVLEGNGFPGANGREEYREISRAAASFH